MTLPLEVLEAVQAGRCILALGTHASEEAARAVGRVWHLAPDLARRLGWAPPRRLAGQRGRHLVPSVEEGAAAFEATHGRDALVRLLRGLVGLEDVPPTAAHRTALRRFPVILTTAWDGLLQRCAREEGIAARFLHRGQPLCEPADGPVVLCMRGTFAEPASLVVTARDHAVPPSADAHRAFRALLRSHLLLFVGYGPDDEELDRLWEDLTDLWGGELPRCHLAVVQGRMDDFLWQKWIWRACALFTADPIECMAEIEAGIAA
ncbi:MAG: SIR2 family protein [Deltaproteobacteria bacterium]|nr:SIR2 family protein [Deltaproteobacteria bacterium]